MRLQCSTCGKPLEMRWQEWREDGTCAEHGGEYVTIDGRPVCDPCDWHQRQNRASQPRLAEDIHELTDEDRAAHDDRPGTWDWQHAWRDQMHVYRDPHASSGSGGRGKRFSGQNRGTSTETEAWDE